MFVVISKFTVEDENNMADTVKKAYIARPHLVENAPGFERLDVLSPLENPGEIWLLTYWKDQPSFEGWLTNHHSKNRIRIFQKA